MTRTVIYARYSGDRQRETSIDDQVRNCTRYADREGMSVVLVFQDKAITGAVSSRPGYQQLLAHAAEGRFDVLLVDDLSRLSRDDYEMKGVLRRLTWGGIRVVGVTDGYDSSSKGHKIHAGFKGLMNELFLDDLRERTHRGMTGQAIKGYNCGGRTYGYRNVPIDDPHRKDAYGRPAIIAVKYEVDAAQAAVVRDIFKWYAAGRSCQSIAHELNRKRIPSSRGTSWAMSAISTILDNRMYEGHLEWNRRSWVKHPDTGKRTYRQRPQEEWIVAENPSLRVVDAELVDTVRERRRMQKAKWSTAQRTATQPAQRYLFSGVLTCGECGGRMSIVAGGRYGCAAHKTQGNTVCGNGITVSRHIVEDRLLSSIKTQLLTSENLDAFKLAASQAIDARRASADTESLRKRLKEAVEVRGNVLEAIKQGIATPAVREAMEAAESEIATLKKRVAQADTLNVSSILPRAVERYQQAVTQLQDTLTEQVEQARHIIKTLFGDTIRIHRMGDHLEAELPDHVSSFLTNTLNLRVDLHGCGGRQSRKSTRVSLTPTPQDSIPHKHRRRRHL